MILFPLYFCLMINIPIHLTSQIILLTLFQYTLFLNLWICYTSSQIAKYNCFPKKTGTSLDTRAENICPSRDQLQECSPMANCPYVILYQTYLQPLGYFLRLHPWERMDPFLELSHLTNPKHKLLHYTYGLYTQWWIRRGFTTESSPIIF